MTQSESRTLRDVCQLIVDCEHKTAPTQETGYPSIRTPNIGRGRLILDNANRVSRETYKTWTRRAIPQGGDLVLAREAPVGNVAIIPANLKVCLGQRTVLIRPDKSQVDPDYLVYLLLGDEIQGTFAAYASGATVPHLNLRDIRSLDLPQLPPLQTQRKIATILSAYDDLIENNTCRIKILEEIARLIYREWFVHFRFPGHEGVRMVDSELGPIPEGWEVCQLGDVIELAYGKGLRKADRIPGPCPVYGSSGVIDSHNEWLVDGPGIIVGRKGNVGSVFWSQVPFYPIDTVFYVRTKIDLYYVYYSLLHQTFLSTDTAVPGLKRGLAYLLPMLLPDHEVIRRFQDFIGPAFRLIRCLRLRNAVLSRSRVLLLPRLISGEIDVSELDIDAGGLD